MSYYETGSYKLLVKSKSRKLILAFIIANVIFGNSAIVGYLITNLVIIIAVFSASSPFDETTQLVSGFISAIILWLGYLWLKIYFFKFIYLKTQKLEASTSLFKFLNTFLYNSKIKILVIFLAILFDCIIMSIYAYLHFKSIAPEYWIATPEAISNLLLLGGITPCYVIFALIGKNKPKEKKDI